MALKTDRLNRLATLLENYRSGDDVPQFTLDAWARTEQRRGGLLGLRKITCHTHACAVGLACLSGEFARDGLGWALDGDSILPTFRSGGYKVEEWKAVEKCFGLTKAQAIKLFDGGDYDGPINGPEAAKAVAANIRALIAPKPKRVRALKRTAKAVEAIKTAALAPVE